jgi:ATP-dependent DNA helicase RecQ
LGDVIRALGNPTVLALTATATQKVMDDIVRQLERPSMHIVNRGIYRSNLNYSVVQATSEDEKLTKLQALIQNEGSGIIYCATVKAVEALVPALSKIENRITPYHGRLPAKVRSKNQQRFMEGDSRIMVATNAFGMGIDKPDIRFVVHYQIPGNLESYYQESGRAGRDGQPAACSLLYDMQDRRIQQFFLARHQPSREDLEAVYRAMRVEDQPVIELRQLHERLPQYSLRRLQVILKLLEQAQLVAADKTLRYRLLSEDARPETLNQLAQTAHKKGEHDRHALERMVFYAQSGFCRWKILQEYFDEKAEWDQCGHCDNCLNPPAQAVSKGLPDWKSGPDLSRAAKAKADSRFHVGAAVEVTKFGKGRVVATTDDMVTLIFADSQERRFLKSYLKQVERVPEGPPEPKAGALPTKGA